VIVLPASSAKGASAVPSTIAFGAVVLWLQDSPGVAVGLGDGVGDGVGEGVGLGVGVGEGVGTGEGVGVWKAGTSQLLPHPPLPPLHAARAAGAIKATSAARRRT
jgi:hypothetical protein